MDVMPDQHSFVTKGPLGDAQTSLIPLLGRPDGDLTPPVRLRRELQLVCFGA